MRAKGARFDAVRLGDFAMAGKQHPRWWLDQRGHGMRFKAPHVA